MTNIPLSTSEIRELYIVQLNKTHACGGFCTKHKKQRPNEASKKFY